MCKTALLLLVKIILFLAENTKYLKINTFLENILFKSTFFSNQIRENMTEFSFS